MVFDFSGSPSCVIVRFAPRYSRDWMVVHLS